MDNDNSVPLGIVCTPAQYELSLTDRSIYCLTHNETIALMAPTLAALVSLFALSFVFTIFLRNIAWRVRHASKKEVPISGGPMDFLLLSLFSGGFLQVLGAVVGFKWINDGKVEVGGLCSAQGIMQQLGETVEALTILVVTVYAFLGGWLRKDIKTWPVWITQGILTAIWLFITFMTMLGNVINRDKTHFEAPTPYWCWISADYFQWRLWGQYFWWWLTLGVSFLICIPLYLWSRGNLQFDERAWWKFRFQKASSSIDPELKAIKRQSLVMLAYSVVYCISILPLSIVRWISFISDSVHISSTTSLAVATIFSLTPASNVALLLATRTDSFFFGKPPKNFTSGCPSLRDSQKYSLRKLEKSKDGKNIGSVARESSI